MLGAYQVTTQKHLSVPEGVEMQNELRAQLVKYQHKIFLMWRDMQVQETQ